VNKNIKMPDGRSIFVTERCSGSSQDTSWNNISEPFLPGIGINNITSLTEFLLTLCIMDPFSKGKQHCLMVFSVWFNRHDSDKENIWLRTGEVTRDEVDYSREVL
jgi:hypothetical protein